MHRLAWIALAIIVYPAVTHAQPQPAARATEDATALTIIDKPIAFDDERKQLTVAYRRAHQDPDASTITIDPKMIVLHYTSGGSSNGTWRYFNRTRMTGREKLRRAGAVNVSAHFLVDRDGTIYRLVPETWMARHCVGLNHVAIGVENVADNGDQYPLTNAQIEANAALVRYLAARHDITHLIGHHESGAMEGTPLFVERDPHYRNQKPDPGPVFMRAVRAKLTDLALEGPPERQ